jgi:hypothetical protein
MGKDNSRIGKMSQTPGKNRKWFSHYRLTKRKSVALSGAKGLYDG